MEEEQSPLVQKRFIETQDTVAAVISIDKPELMIIDEKGDDGLPVGYGGHQQSNMSMTLKRGHGARSSDIVTEKNSVRNSVSAPRSPVSGASKVGSNSRKAVKRHTNDEDEFRQQIEKEDLDKILNQEIDYEEDQLGMTGGLASKSNQGR